uniref:Uncharacterized protein n=1 Tax=Anopheles atroparvus TaxID=41427 RepID=A0AAG5D3J5_ANOAO
MPWNGRAVRQQGTHGRAAIAVLGKHHPARSDWKCVPRAEYECVPAAAKAQHTGPEALFNRADRTGQAAQ